MTWLCSAEADDHSAAMAKRGVYSRIFSQLNVSCFLSCFFVINRGHHFWFLFFPLSFFFGFPTVLPLTAPYRPTCSANRLAVRHCMSSTIRSVGLCFGSMSRGSLLRQLSRDIVPYLSVQAPDSSAVLLPLPAVSRESSTGEVLWTLSIFYLEIKSVHPNAFLAQTPKRTQGSVKLTEARKHSFYFDSRRPVHNRA
ncbi:hypothetical protein BKA56DRAFT_124161 [Ilyonectria sp. MPI-CAGE-AT-0026]|nr:hypothetical protein BKA56DRAFT_124161 [Ilyonectria sp. MPI-CAGE-AT-0026]